jgi:hypothetical protein
MDWRGQVPVELRERAARRAASNSDDIEEPRY